MVVAVRSDVAEVLHAEVVLVGEEVGQPVVGHRLAQHVLRRDHALPDGVVPVLHAQMTAEQRVVGVGHVAGREDVGLGGAQVFVDHDAVVGSQAGGRGEGGVRRDPDPDDEQVGLDRWSRLPVSRSPARRRLDGGDLVPTRRSTPCAVCRSAKMRATSGPRTRTRGRSRASRMVTWAPARRAAAATSRPIQPPPMITSRRPGRSRDLIGRRPRRCAGRRRARRCRRPSRGGGAAIRWRAAACRSAC